MPKINQYDKEKDTTMTQKLSEKLQQTSELAAKDMTSLISLQAIMAVPSAALAPYIYGRLMMLANTMEKRSEMMRGNPIGYHVTLLMAETMRAEADSLFEATIKSTPDSRYTNDLFKALTGIEDLIKDAVASGEFVNDLVFEEPRND